MRAMILAAGRGERMRPLTDDVPKPLLTAGGRPLIVWHLLRLADAGIHDVVVNHAWLGGRIEASLGDGSAFGVRIRYSAEAVALETAGGIARAMPLLCRAATGAHDGRGVSVDPAPPPAMPFLVISGDTFCDFDYGRARTIALQMLQARLSCWCVMVGNPPHHAGGDFPLAGGLLTMPRSTLPRLTYSGIGLYTAAMFGGIAPGERSALRPWLEREIAAGRAAGEYHGGLWFDIGTAQRLADLDRLLEARSINVGV
jgi:MurNAc alpha-1-phosphate uridylyltransferase